MIQTDSYSYPGHIIRTPGFFDRRPRLLGITLLVIFLLAGAVRLYKLEAPGVLIDRDFTSAILARDFYFQHVDFEPWREEIAHITRQKQPVLEPPITEFLASLIYWTIGRESLGAARLLTSFFWLLGGIFLFRIVRTLESTDAAVFAAGYYLLAPMSILLSRSFQPDSLMMLLFMASLYTILRFFEKPSGLGLVLAATISGLALLYRPLILFALLGAFTALVIDRKGLRNSIMDKQLLVFVALSLLPAVLYYGYGIAVAGFLRWKVETSFRPDLFWYREFWTGWLELAVNSAGYSTLIGAAIGLPLLGSRPARAMVMGLGAGYGVFSLVFTMHSHTHGYYHAQLIPITAIAAGAVITLIADRLRQVSTRWYWCLPILGVLVLSLYFSLSQVKSSLGHQVFEDPATARQIGQIVHHSSKVVYLSRYYGMPLQYYGEFSGAYWFRPVTYYLYRRPQDRELTIRERLDRLNFSPEYFVITDFKEFDNHHADLKEYLARNCGLIAQTDRYLIYAFKNKTHLIESF